MLVDKASNAVIDAISTVSMSAQTHGQISFSHLPPTSSSSFWAFILSSTNNNFNPVHRLQEWAQFLTDIIWLYWKRSGQLSGFGQNLVRTETISSEMLWDVVDLNWTHIIRGNQLNEQEMMGLNSYTTHTHTQLRQLDILVAKADVLRLEDLSVGRFAADDNIQFVHRLHHSPGKCSQ